MTERSIPNDGAIPFLLVFQGRTGSTFLVEALDSHPDVRADYERLSSTKWEKMGGDAQLEFARGLLTPPDRADWRATGFKTKLRDVLDPAGLSELLRDVRALVIHLKRRNLVKLAVSSFNSQRVHERTGDWNLYEREPAVAQPLAIDPGWFAEALQRKVDHEAAIDRFVAETTRPALTIFYEDLLVDTEATVSLVFRFLGVDPISARGRTRKATSDDLRQALANFDELRSSVAGTRYEPMFDEVLMPADPSR